MFPLNTKMVLTGISSDLLIKNKSPTFYFYFNVTDSAVSDFGIKESVAVQSPDEFNLVKFSIKKDSREISVGKESYYYGAPTATRLGVDPEKTIKFSSKEISKGTFKIDFFSPLDAGEYAFIFTGANGESRLYDFSIVAQP